MAGEFAIETGERWRRLWFRPSRDERAGEPASEAERLFSWGGVRHGISQDPTLKLKHAAANA